MSKNRNRSKDKTMPCWWLSANSDNKKNQYIVVGESLFKSEQYQELTIGARFLYLCMSMNGGGKMQFTFPRKIAGVYGIKESSLRNYVDELERKGFITRYSNAHRCKANDYEFRRSWKLFGIPILNAPVPESRSDAAQTPPLS